MAWISDPVPSDDVGGSLGTFPQGTVVDVTGPAQYSAADGHWYYPVRVAKSGQIGYVAAGESGVPWLAASQPFTPLMDAVSPSREFPSTTVANSTPPVITAASAINQPASQPPPQESGFNAQGYDKSGFNRSGYDRSGYNRKGLDKDRYDRSGYNSSGYNRGGYNRAGQKKPWWMFW